MITKINTKEIRDVIIPKNEEIRRGAVVNEVIPSIAKLMSFK